MGTTFRGELGQYFTPRTIVDFMTHILDPKENETVCDPTCGSGGFLIKAFEYMREKIEEDVKKAKSELRSVIEGENYDSLSEKEQVVINERIEAMQSTLNKELDTQVEGAGITSTGAVSAGNQLPTLQDEYKEYRIAKKLWNEANSVVSYTINSQGRLFRTSDGKEVELKW